MMAMMCQRERSEIIQARAVILAEQRARHAASGLAAHEGR